MTYLCGNDLGRYLGDSRGNRFAGATIVGHLELDGIANLQMLDVAVKLAEVEEQAGLPLAALDKAVRVKQLLDDAGLASALAAGGALPGTRRPRVPASGLERVHPAALVAVHSAATVRRVHREHVRLRKDVSARAAAAHRHRHWGRSLRLSAVVAVHAHVEAVAALKHAPRLVERSLLAAGTVRLAAKPGHATDRAVFGHGGPTDRGRRDRLVVPEVSVSTDVPAAVRHGFFEARVEPAQAAVHVSSESGLEAARSERFRLLSAVHALITEAVEPTVAGRGRRLRERGGDAVGRNGRWSPVHG